MEMPLLFQNAEKNLLCSSWEGAFLGDNQWENRLDNKGIWERYFWSEEGKAIEGNTAVVAQRSHVAEKRVDWAGGERWQLIN